MCVSVLLSVCLSVCCSQGSYNIHNLLCLPQSDVDREVALLLDLKAQYKELTGEELGGGGGGKKKKGGGAEKKVEEKKKPPVVVEKEGGAEAIKHKTRWVLHTHTHTHIHT